jgi:hypothetical protein
MATSPSGWLPVLWREGKGKWHDAVAAVKSSPRNSHDSPRSVNSSNDGGGGSSSSDGGLRQPLLHAGDEDGSAAPAIVASTD